MYGRKYRAASGWDAGEPSPCVSWRNCGCRYVIPPHGVNPNDEREAGMAIAEIDAEGVRWEVDPRH